jgi:hypothetical protein
MTETTNAAVDQSVAILQALLREEFDTYRRLNSSLPQSAKPAFAVVLGSAFAEAAERRFGDPPDNSEIIRFVAEARAVYTRTGEKVSAEDAEQVIRGMLGEDRLLEEMDGRTIGSAQTAMLFAMVHESRESVSRIDELLEGARERAYSFFQRNAPK